MPVVTTLQDLDLSAFVKPGDTVLIGQADSEPLPLSRALAHQRAAIGGRFQVFVGINYGDAFEPAHSDCIDFLSYCGTGSNRPLARAGALDILPCHYSAFPALIRNGRLRPDVVMLQVAPADAQGRYSLGLAHEFMCTAIRHARTVIVEVNEQCPWTFGDGHLGDEDIDLLVRTSRPPLQSPAVVPGDVELAIAAHVAPLIEDGATLQFGLGAMPEAILSALGGHRDLGVHSGTIGDKVAELTEAGVITNARKSVDVGLTVTGMLMGSSRVHRFAHRNAGVRLRATESIHGGAALSQHKRFTALNSAIEVDLTGQIGAEVAGGTYLGAVGGALDFLRAAATAERGLPVVALPSMAGRASRIVARLSGPVSTPRSDAGVIVTEHGAADLRGLSLRRRVERMIAIAHPEQREALARDIHGTLGI